MLHFVNQDCVVTVTRYKLSLFYSKRMTELNLKLAPNVHQFGLSQVEGQEYMKLDSFLPSFLYRKS